MRVPVFVSALSLLAVAPAWAQSPLTLAPRTTLAAHVMCTDSLVPAPPTPTLRLAGPHNAYPHLVLSRGDEAVLRRVPEDGLAVGQRYLVRRLPVGVQAELPKEGGYIPIRTLGWLTVTALDEVNAIAHVDYACDALEPDDYLEPYTEAVLPAPDAALPPPDFSERVQILPGVEGRQLFGGGDMFSIARGSDHGVMAGARFAIYRDRKDGKPLVHIGEAIVTELSATSSKVILVKTVDAVGPADIAVPRR